MALMEALQKAEDGNFLRCLAADSHGGGLEGMIGAGRYERSGERSTWRNGYGDRTLDTRLGRLNLRIPKLRTGGYFPPFLEARKTTELPGLLGAPQDPFVFGIGRAVAVRFGDGTDMADGEALRGKRGPKRGAPVQKSGSANGPSRETRALRRERMSATRSLPVTK
jgi:hypothetical protein